MATVVEVLAQAWQNHQAGNLPQAEQIYRQILKGDPCHVEAMCLLGALCQTQGNLEEASSLYRRALQLWPGHTLAQNGLGIILAQQGKLDESAVIFQEVTRTQPKDAEAFNNLGLVRLTQGRVEEAVACYRRALQIRPDFTAAQNNLNLALGRAKDEREPPPPMIPTVTSNVAATVQATIQRGASFTQQGRYQEAQQLLEQAVRMQPNNAEALTQLGHAFVRQEKYTEAIVQYQQALQLNQDNFEAQYILAIALHERGDLADAVTHYNHAVRLRPNFEQPYNNLSSALLNQGRLEEAITCCQKAIRIKPDFAEAYSNMGCALLKQAQLERAVSSLRRALQLQPNLPAGRSNFLFCLNYDPQIDPDVVFAEHRQWGVLHGPTTPLPSPENDPSPERRLRIGYVSPDFRHHALTRYFESVLAHHDPQKTEIFCYAEVMVPDTMTTRLQNLAHQWRSTCRLTDAQVAQRIRDDRIDILVDLAGHTASNRLLTFGLRPAPVQATWLGYLNTTGLSTIDYRLTDAVMDPPGQPVRDTEELVRLPGGFCCFTPPPNSSEVAPLPALRQGHVTFGSLNNSMKLNANVFDLWSQVLQAVPTARLLMFRDTLTATVREQLRWQFSERGIANDRLDMRQWSGSTSYLHIFDEIDVSLDTFPYTGGVTTCESLWMGVPVLSLCGVRPAGRHSASLLARVGLSDWAVQTPEEYVALAVRWAKDLEKLAELRAGLRDRALANLCDAKQFTQALEDAYRTMWRRWCAQRNKSGGSIKSSF